MDDREMKMSMIAELEKQKEQLCAALDGRIAELKSELSDETYNRIGKFYKNGWNTLFAVLDVQQDDYLVFICNDDWEHEYGSMSQDIYTEDDMDYLTEISKDEAIVLFQDICKKIAEDIF